MTVDLSKAQKGSKVTFRCGGEAVIGAVAYDDIRYNIVFNTYEGKGPFNYSKRGTHCGAIKPDFQSPLDIIEIIPPEFDWSTVKWGQAFKDEDGVWIYIGPSKDKGKLIFEHTLGDFGPTCVRLSYAQEYKTRVPKHDITEEVE